MTLSTPLTKHILGYFSDHSIIQGYMANGYAVTLCNTAAVSSCYQSIVGRQNFGDEKPPKAYGPKSCTSKPISRMRYFGKRSKPPPTVRGLGVHSSPARDGTQP